MGGDDTLAVLLGVHLHRLQIVVYYVTHRRLKGKNIIPGDHLVIFAALSGSHLNLVDAGVAAESWLRTN